MLLDIDTCSERLVMAGLKLAGQDPMDRDSAYFKENYREVIYETLLDIAKENLPHCDVVVVGPFTKEIRDENWVEVLEERLNSKVIVVYVYCEPKERKARLLARANPRDEGKFKDYDQFNGYYGDEAPPACEHTVIETSQLKTLG